MVGFKVVSGNLNAISSRVIFCIPGVKILSFLHVPHSYTTGNPFVASKGMGRLSNGQKDFCNSKTNKKCFEQKVVSLKGTDSR